MRRRQAMAEDQVREQQIVDMATMARHIDDTVARRDVRQRFEVVRLDAVIKMLQQPGEQEFRRAQDAIGVVGGNLQREPVRLGLRLAQRDPETGRLLTDRRAHRIAGQQHLDLRVAVGKVGADGHFPLPPEMHAQHTRHLAQGRCGVERGGPALDQFAQGQWPVEAHQCLPPVQQHRKKLAQPARRAPGLGEQRLEDGFLLVGAATPEHHHRHQLHIEGRVRHHRPQLVDQQAGSSRRGALATPVEEEQRTLRPDAAERERRLGRRQACASRLFEKDKQVR